MVTLADPGPDKIRNRFVSCGVIAMKETAEGLGVGLCTFQGCYFFVLTLRKKIKNHPELHQPDSEYLRLLRRRLLDFRDASFLKITKMMTKVSNRMHTITKHKMRPSIQKWDLLL